MAIQPFAMQGQTAEFMLPSQAMAGAERLKGLQNQNAMFDMEVQDKKDAAAANQRLNALFQQSGGDLSKMRQSVGDFRTAMTLDKQIGENAKLQGEGDKARLESGIKKLEYGSQLLQGATPENWQDIRREFGQMTGQDLGEQFDPAKVGALMQQGLSMKDKLENEWKQKGYELDVAQFGESQRHHMVSEGISQQNANKYSGSDGGGKPPPGYRWTPDGGQEPIPGGPADQKLKGDQAKVSANAGKQLAAAAQARKDAEDSNALIAQADPLFDTATGSGLGSMRDAAYAAVGSSTTGAQSAAQLKVIGGTLMSKVPKMSGPQSDADVRNYKEMAGQVGNEALPIETRRAALKAVKEINDRQIAYHNAVSAVQAENEKSSAATTDKPSLDDIFGGQ